MAALAEPKSAALAKTTLCVKSGEVTVILAAEEDRIYSNLSKK